MTTQRAEKRLAAEVQKTRFSKKMCIKTKVGIEMKKKEKAAQDANDVDKLKRYIKELMQDNKAMKQRLEALDSEKRWLESSLNLARVYEKGRNEKMRRLQNLLSEQRGLCRCGN